MNATLIMAVVILQKASVSTLLEATTAHANRATSWRRIVNSSVKVGCLCFQTVSKARISCICRGRQQWNKHIEKNAFIWCFHPQETGADNKECATYFHMTGEAFPCYSRLGCEIRVSLMLFWLPIHQRCLWSSKRKLQEFNITFTTYLMNFTKCFFFFNARKKVRFVVNYLALLSLPKFPRHLRRDTIALHVNCCLWIAQSFIRKLPSSNAASFDYPLAQAIAMTQGDAELRFL